jgi:DNA-binding Lrp family transcriptional regulator
LILAIEPASRTVYLKKPLNAMASEIGLTQEALYRAIAALETAGRIRRRGKRIDLIDV